METARRRRIRRGGTCAEVREVPEVRIWPRIRETSFQTGGQAGALQRGAFLRSQRGVLALSSKAIPNRSPIKSPPGHRLVASAKKGRGIGRAPGNMGHEGDGRCFSVVAVVNSSTGLPDRLQGGALAHDTIDERIWRPEASRVTRGEGVGRDGCGTDAGTAVVHR